MRLERDIIQQWRIFRPLTSPYFAILLPWLYIPAMTKKRFFSFDAFPRVRTRPISAPNRSTRVLLATVSVSQVYQPHRLDTNGCKLREWKGVPMWKHYRAKESFPSGRTGTLSGLSTLARPCNSRRIQNAHHPSRVEDRQMMQKDFVINSLARETAKLDAFFSNQSSFLVTLNYIHKQIMYIFMYVQ